MNSIAATRKPLSFEYEYRPRLSTSTKIQSLQTFWHESAVSISRKCPKSLEYPILVSAHDLTHPLAANGFGEICGAIIHVGFPVDAACLFDLLEWSRHRDQTSVVKQSVGMTR
jgi:hypothetical protein